MDIISYLLGKNSAGGGGGGSDFPTFTSVKSLNDYIDSTLSEFKTQMMTLVGTNGASSTQEVTLYTPNSDYQYYLIQKRSNGKYRVAWFKDPFIQLGASSLYLLGWGTQTQNTSNYDISNLILHVLASSASPMSWYYSAEYSTVAECVDLLKSSTASYSTSSSALGYASDTQDAPIPYSNAICVDARTTGDYPFYIPNKISSNETIETI